MWSRLFLVLHHRVIIFSSPCPWPGEEIMNIHSRLAYIFYTVCPFPCLLLRVWGLYLHNCYKGICNESSITRDPIVIAVIIVFVQKMAFSDLWFCLITSQDLRVSSVMFCVKSISDHISILVKSSFNISSREFNDTLFFVFIVFVC